jgi:hypothetical protein
MPRSEEDLVAALHSLVDSLEVEHREAVLEQHAARAQLQQLDRRVQKLEVRLNSLREMLFEVDPALELGTVAAIHGEASRRGSLAGLPRVQAIEIILKEREDRAAHRQEILEALRSRGFPSERIGDTSAALAYLKRTGRVVSAGRGFWRAA